MSQLQARIDQFRKMSSDDPDNEIGHYRLGQALMEAEQWDDAIKSFRRTLELSPQFSRVYLLLAKSLMAQQRNDEAGKVLVQGYTVADERGDNMPREDMGKLLAQLGQPIPESQRPKQAASAAGTGGFRCQRPGCTEGPQARQLTKPPFSDDIGKRIYETVCTVCWDYWFRNISVKVINEMRLDLSTERGQEVYDQIMRETLGLE